MPKGKLSNWSAKFKGVSSNAQRKPQPPFVSRERQLQRHCISEARKRCKLDDVTEAWPTPGQSPSEVTPLGREAAWRVLSSPCPTTSTAPPPTRANLALSGPAPVCFRRTMQSTSGTCFVMLLRWIGWQQPEACLLPTACAPCLVQGAKPLS